MKASTPNISLKDQVYSIYTQMDSEGIIAAYHGGFSQAVVDMLLRQAKHDMVKRKVDRRVLKKTYSILVECLENILKHTFKSGDSDRDGIVVLSTGDGELRITVGNLVNEEDKEPLKQKIDQVNSLAKEDLKQLHMKRLIHGKISNKGGAGLGIIEIAMKSNNNIEYFFRESNDNLVFFALQTSISQSIITNNKK